MGQRLSDSTLVADILADGRNVVVEARTGIGKSYGLIEGLRAAGVPFVFAADTKLLAGQLAATHSLPVYWSDKPEPDDGVSFVTLYNHVDRLADSSFVLVVDEFHSLIADADWRAEVFDGMIPAFARYRQVVGLTGTFIAPIPGFRLVRMDQPAPTLLVDIDERKDAIDAIAEAVADEANHVHAVLVQDTSNIPNQLVEALNKRGVPEDAVLLLNSKTLAEPQATELMRTSTLPENVRVLVTTLRQGYSVRVAKSSPYSGGVVIHLVPTSFVQHSASEMAQMAARFRDSNAVTAVRLYQRYPLQPHSVDFPTWNEIVERQMEEVLCQQRFWYEEHFQEGTFDPAVVPVSWGQSRRRSIEMVPYGLVAGHADPDKLGLLRGDLSPNWYRINRAALENETRSIHRSVDHLDRALRRYNLRVGDHKRAPTPESKAKYGRKEAREARRQRWEALVNRLYDAPVSDFPLYDDDAEIILGLRHGFSNEKVREIALREEHASDVSLLRDRLAAHSPKSPVERQLKRSIASAFDVGSRYSSETIKKKINKVHRETGLLKTSVKSAKEALQLLRWYFDVKEKQNPDYLPGSVNTEPKRLYEIRGSALGTPETMRFWTDPRRW